MTTKNNQRLVADHIGHGNFIGYLKNSDDMEEHEPLRYSTPCLYYPDCPMFRELSFSEMSMIESLFILKCQ